MSLLLGWTLWRDHVKTFGKNKPIDSSFYVIILFCLQADAVLLAILLK